MKQNVLVFPCGTEIGLEIHSSLRFSTHFNLIGAASIEDHGQYVYENCIGGIPFVESPDFVESINQIIKDQKIDFVIPAHDSVAN